MILFSKLYSLFCLFFILVEAWDRINWNNLDMVLGYLLGCLSMVAVGLSVVIWTRSTNHDS